MACKREALVERCAVKIRILDEKFAKGEALPDGTGISLPVWEELRLENATTSLFLHVRPQDAGYFGQEPCTSGGLWLVFQALVGKEIPKSREC